MHSGEMVFWRFFLIFMFFVPEFFTFVFGLSF